MSSTITILDLFCGAGGASAGYADAGFHVIGVDINPQPNYPFDFIQADVMSLGDALLASPFNVIHASPPCQAFTVYRNRGGGVGDSYLDLVDPVRQMLELTGLPYVIENVAGAPLVNPAQFCGSSFGLDLRRHRLFETNWPLVAPPCNHAWQTPRFPAPANNANLRRTVEVGAYRCHKLSPMAMEIDWMTNSEISQAIPPKYTEFIGNQFAGYLRARAAAAPTAESEAA